MSIFGNNSYNEDQDLIPTIEGYSVEDGGDLLAIQESYEDQLEIIKAIHKHDIEEIQAGAKGVTESADFEAVTEASVKNIWEKIKKFFRDLAAKFKSFFLSVIRQFDGMFKSGSDFAKKYEKELNGLDLRGFEYKLYKYTNLDNYNGSQTDSYNGDALISGALKVASNASQQTVEELKKDAQELRDNKEDELDEIRGKVAGKGGSLNPSEFKSALFAHFRGGATSAEDKANTSVSIADVISTLKNTKPKKATEDLAKKFDADFSKALKTVSEIERKMGSGKVGADGTSSYTHGSGDSEQKISFSSAGARQAVIDAVHAYSSMMSASKDIVMTGFRAWREAYAERDREYKHLAMAAFRHKAKKN